MSKLKWCVAWSTRSRMWEQNFCLWSSGRLQYSPSILKEAKLLLSFKQHMQCNLKRTYHNEELTGNQISSSVSWSDENFYLILWLCQTNFNIPSKRICCFGWKRWLQWRYKQYGIEIQIFEEPNMCLYELLINDHPSTASLPLSI